MTIAITRHISSRFNECEITHIERTPIDLEIARSQHEAYVRALAELGCQVIELPEETELPDSVFVEDTAFILPEVAVITRPGADSRKPEVETIIPALSPYRPLLHVAAPATVDGGDVLVAGLTESSDLPGTAGGAQAANAGVDDGFVARLSGDLRAQAASPTQVAPIPTLSQWALLVLAALLGLLAVSRRRAR